MLPAAISRPKLIKADFDVSYAYAMRLRSRPAARVHQHVLYLDYDRRGFAYPVVPFHVNCYGSSVIAKRGSTRTLTGAADPDAVDPPGPNPGRCFDVGAAVARAFVRQPVAGRARSPHRAGRMHS